MDMLSSTKEEAAFFDERALLNPLGIVSPKSLLRPFTIDWVIALGYHSFNPPIFSFFGD
jgi:hypothetical protein